MALPYQQAMPCRLPLTPPEFIPTFEPRGCEAASFSQDPFVAPQGLAPRRDSNMDFSHTYGQLAPSATQRMSYPQNIGYCNPQSLPPITTFAQPLGAPILPPLRIQDNFSDEEYRLRLQQSQRTQALQQQQQQQPQQQQQHQVPKEEKATGGVSANLDYEMEQMTDFVSEAAQGMYALHQSHICLADIDICRSIQPGMTVQPAFRKWVSQVLSATRLPSATILLSLYYLTVRIRDYPESIVSSENQIYRLLAVSLILGSKFLDDNTFINRSWSDVSSIKVTELNNLEIEWLALIGFDLHCDPNDPNGVSNWIRTWKEYEARAASKAIISKLSPIDTNIQRQPSLRNGPSPYKQQHTKSVYGEYTPVSSNSSAYGNTPYLSADPWNRTEPAPVESYYSTSQRYRTLEELDHASRLASLAQGRRSTSTYSRTSLPPLQSFVPASSYYSYSPWNQPSWSGGHAHGCNCMGCTRQYNSYMMGPGHAAQTVVG